MYSIMYSELVRFSLEMNVRQSVGRNTPIIIDEGETFTEPSNWRSPGDYEQPPSYSGPDDDMSALQNMGSNVDSDWDYTDVRNQDYTQQVNVDFELPDIDRADAYPEMERDLDSLYDDPGYVDEYAWRIGSYTDETLPQAMFEDYYR